MRTFTSLAQPQVPVTVVTQRMDVEGAAEAACIAETIVRVLF